MQVSSFLRGTVTMLFKIKSFASFFWNSTNQHGVHSPFVYNLVTKCFYDKKRHTEYSILKKKYTINKTATSVKTSLKCLKLVHRMVAYFQPTTIYISADTASVVKHAIELGSPKAQIRRIDALNKLQSAHLIYFETSNYLKYSSQQFELLFTSVSNETVWIFNAIYANHETKKVWQAIKNHPKVRVTVATFAVGLVFFRIEQQKEHFVIRV